jgi:hypothetical protein
MWFEIENQGRAFVQSLGDFHGCLEFKPEYALCYSPETPNLTLPVT